METKKLGFLIIGMSIVLGFIIFNFMDSLSLQSNKMQCNPTHECKQINSVLGVSHIAIGFLAFIFALGFYLLFFNKDEKEILEKYGFNNPNSINNMNSLNNNPINNSNNNINTLNNNPIIKNFNDKNNNSLNNNKLIKNLNYQNNNPLISNINNQVNNLIKEGQINTTYQENDKFSLLLRPLDDSQKKVLMAIKEQEGITQSTLRFRTDLSKSKVSQILTDFEKKNLVERKAKGKTYSVFLAENF